MFVFMYILFRIRIVGVYNENEEAVSTTEPAPEAGLSSSTEEAATQDKEKVTSEQSSEESSEGSEGEVKPSDADQDSSVAHSTAPAVILQPFGFLTRLRPSFVPYDSKLGSGEASTTGKVGWW